MKALLYTLLSYSLLFNISIASAQGWQKTFADSTGPSIAIDVVATNDGYLLAGELDLVTGAIRHYFKILKTDLDGNLEWSKTFQEPWAVAEEAVAFIDQTSDGNFILGGLQNRSPFLMKLNSSGDTLWTKKKESLDNSKFIYAGILLQDGGFLLSGTNILPIGSLEITSPYLIKFDSDGNFLWESTLEITTNHHVIYDVKETTDQGFILAGHNDNSKSILVKTNNLGNLQWNKEYELTANNSGGSVVETSDNGFILGGSTDGIPGQIPFFLKVDAEGIFDWLKFHPNLPVGRVSYIEHTSDNGYIATGSFLGFWQNIGINGFAIKLDENGEEEWIEEFNSGFHGSTIHEISDNIFIACGFSNEGFLLKKIGGTNSTEKIFSPEINLSISPNPMTDFTTFKIETEEFQTFQLRVFNSIGQLVRTERFNTSIFNFYKKNLSSGIYFFEISSEEKLLANGKLEIH